MADRTIIKLQRAIGKLEDQKGKLSDENATLRRDLSSLNNRCKNLKSDLETCQENFQKLNKIYLERDAELKSARQEKNKLKKENKELEDDKKKLEDENREQKKHLTICSAKHGELEKQIKAHNTVFGGVKANKTVPTVAPSYQSVTGRPSAQVTGRPSAPGRGTVAPASGAESGLEALRNRARAAVGQTARGAVLRPSEKQIQGSRLLNDDTQKYYYWQQEGYTSEQALDLAKNNAPHVPWSLKTSPKRKRKTSPKRKRKTSPKRKRKTSPKRKKKK